MPMATEHPTTTSRRSALRGLGIAAITAGLRVPALATPAAPPDDNKELIALCSEVVTIMGKFDALFAIRRTYEDELRTEPQLSSLYDELNEVLDQIAGRPLTTLAGARSMGCAALALASRDDKGEIDTSDRDDSEWLAWTVAEWAATESAQA